MLLAVAVSCLSPAIVSSQQRPFDTSPCGLLSNPDKYNEGLVSVEGLIVIGPEEFTLHDASCGDETGRIWLEFGGDVENPAMPASSRRTSTRPRTFDGLELPITKDRDFDALQTLLRLARETGKTKMVRATLTGMYFAGRPGKSAGGGMVRTGFGRTGCCSMLVIEEVGTVEAALEDAVDFSPVAELAKPSKGCTITQLPVPSREEADQLLRKSLEEDYQYLHHPSQVAARALAGTESIDAEAAEARLRTDSASGVLASYTWVAADGMKSYRVTVNRPYWLLQSLGDGDAVIWAPKQIVRTECVKLAKK